MPSIQDENVWTLQAFLGKLVGQYWRRRYWIFLIKSVPVFLLTILNPPIASSKSNAVIVKLSRGKDCQQVCHIKKDLQKSKMEDLDLSGSNELFINISLCPHYKVLWSKSKKLHSHGKIHGFFIFSDTIKIKINEYSVPLSVTQFYNFRNYFLDVYLWSLSS